MVLKVSSIRTMFIEQAYKPENKFWKYILGSLLIILASSIGQIALFLAVLAKCNNWNFYCSKIFP